MKLFKFAATVSLTLFAVSATGNAFAADGGGWGEIGEGLSNTWDKATGFFQQGADQAGNIIDKGKDLIDPAP